MSAGVSATSRTVAPAAASTSAVRSSSAWVSPVGVLPGRGAAKADARRGGRAVDPVRLLRQQHAAQQRDVLEAAADDAQRVEIVALHLDADRG